jgi:hypothetical protein
MQASRIRIDEPCHEDWGAMRPEGARRFCDRCDKHVHDLSALTELEAQAVLAARDSARVCVRYLVDVEGTIVFRQPAPVVPVSALRRRRPPIVRAAAMALALAACTPHEQTMGEPAPIAIDEKAEPTPPQVEIPPVPQPEPVVREVKGEFSMDDMPAKPQPLPAQHVKMGRVSPAVQHRGG